MAAINFVAARSYFIPISSVIAFDFASDLKGKTK